MRDRGRTRLIEPKSPQIRIPVQEGRAMKRLTAYVLISCFLGATAASAEPSGTVPGIRASMAHVRFSDLARDKSSTSAARTHTNSPAQKATAAVTMGFLGMIAGAW